MVASFASDRPDHRAQRLPHRVLGFMIFPLSTCLAAVLNFWILVRSCCRRRSAASRWALWRATPWRLAVAAAACGGAAWLGGQPASGRAARGGASSPPSERRRQRRSRPGGILRGLAAPGYHRNARLRPPLPAPLRRGQTLCVTEMGIIMPSPHGRSAAGYVSPGERRCRRPFVQRSPMSRPDELEGPRVGRRAPPPDLRRRRPELWQDRARPEGPPRGHGLLRRCHPGRARRARPGDRRPRRAEGDKLVGTFCIYVPEEIILALAPSRWRSAAGPPPPSPTPRRCCRGTSARWSSPPSAWPCPDTCPYAPIEDLAVGETTCDAKKKTGKLRRRRTLPRARGAAEEGRPRPRPAARGGGGSSRAASRR